jgi:putative spermidine/putrescine transport system permease protein
MSLAVVRAPHRDSFGMGRLRWVLLALVALYLLMPVMATGLYSVATLWRSTAFPDGYTLQWYRDTLTDGRLLDAAVRSLTVALGAVVLCNLLVVPALYWSHVRNPRIRTVMSICALLPFSLPFLVMAFGIKSVVGLWTVTAPYEASRTLLLLGHVALAFPFLLWPVDAAMQSADVKRLHEAASTMGAGAWTTLRTAIVPNIATGVLTGSVLVFATSLGEYSIARIVTGTSFETLPVWQVSELNDTSGNPNGVAVITMALFALLLVCTALVVRAGGGGLVAGVAAGDSGEATARRATT